MPADNVIINAALSGTKIERKTTMSKSTLRLITAAIKIGRPAFILSAISMNTAVKPPTNAIPPAAIKARKSGEIRKLRCLEKTALYRFSESLIVHPGGGVAPRRQ